jgi:iron-sulfur cluster protein
MARSLRLYHEYIKEALEDKYLQGVLDNFEKQYKINREEVFKGIDTETLFNEISSCKDNALNNIELLYHTFKKEAEKRGIIVHRAKDAKECCDIVVSIAKENNLQKIIKTKSMTCEEIHLNEVLEKNGLNVCETDLGEWIVQLRKEVPSHMVLPAIHLSRIQVADTFSEEIKEKLDGNIDKLVKVARKELRAKFVEADMGITGANFLIAESGTIGLLSNEGNARLVTTLPKVLVSIAGLEKLIPNIGEALKIIEALPRNATAQKITSYVTWITGQLESNLTEDKKKIQYIIVLDNGRTELLLNKHSKDILRCVRCGACANVCPVYRVVGGHRQGHVYIGAVGLILTYFYHGIDEARHLVYNCIGCEACREVCPAKIDLPMIIYEVRNLMNKKEGPEVSASLLSLILPNRKIFHFFLKLLGKLQFPYSDGKIIRHLPFIFGEDHGFRAIPTIACKSFRELLPQEELLEDTKIKVSIFSGCAHEFMFPSELINGVRLLTKKGVSVSFPLDQGCCGLPALTMGQKKTAVKIAEYNLEVFKDEKTDYIISLCPSCTSHMKLKYELLLADKPEIYKEVKKFTAKIMDFSSFLYNVVKFTKEDFVENGEKAAFHSSCHQCHGLKVTKEPRELLKLAGTYVESEDEELCCGFGGTFSLKYPEISGSLAERKLKKLEALGASTIVTDCPGCVMQLLGTEEKRGKIIPVEHMADFLARLFKPKV